MNISFNGTNTAFNYQGNLTGHIVTPSNKTDWASAREELASNTDGNIRNPNSFREAPLYLTVTYDHRGQNSSYFGQENYIEVTDPITKQQSTLSSKGFEVVA